MEPGGLSRLPGVTRLVENDRRRLAVGLGLGVLTLAFVVAGTYVPASVEHGPGRFVPFLLGLPAVAIAVLAALDPFVGLLAWVVLMPVLNVSRAQVTLGPLQLILSTFLLLAVLVGVAMDRAGRARGASATSPADARAIEAPARGHSDRRLEQLAVVGVVGLLALAVLATAASPDLARSLPVGLHGVIEPALLAGIVLALRPNRSQLAWLALAMGASVGLATVINLARTLPANHSLAALQDQRALLARLTYFNVGIFGDMLVMALPLLLASILARRRLGLPRVVTLGLLASAGLALVALFLTFSKGAWLGGLATLALFALLAARTWRVRLAMLAALFAASTLVIPYPLLLRQALGQGGSDPGGGVVGGLLGFERAASWDLSTGEGETSIRERLLATEGAARMTLDHPLLGVGPGRFPVEYAASYRPASSTRALDSAHDFLPNLAAEFGLPVALLVALALVAALLGAWRSYRRDDPVLAAGVLAALAGFLVTATLFGVDLYRPYRTMDSDVLFAALLVALGLRLGALASATRTPATTAQVKLG